MPERLSYQDSCRLLQEKNVLEQGEIPPLLPQPPRYDDEVLGVDFFRTLLADVNLQNLTLPRTFFGRSEIRDCSFCGSDLSESTANWNDFVRVDFSSADLSNCDFRGCAISEVRFSGAILAKADFRRCGLTKCDFTGAQLAGTKIAKKISSSLSLSDEQRRVIDWHENDGDEPEG
jgi:uncharacterized protein YjbI with pentapeptide repeats